MAELKARMRKTPSGSIGWAVRASQARNAEQERDTGTDGPDDLGAGPAEVVAVDDAPHDGEEPGADEAEPGDVEPALRAVALGQAQRARAA